jgi:hypothetical protein
MRLVNEILDKQLLDKDEVRMGRADGIVLELIDGQPPRVAAVEVGPITLLRRFSSKLARAYARLDRQFGPERGVSYRISLSLIGIKAGRIHVALKAHDTPVLAVEDWLSAKIVDRIPGSK